MCCLKKDLSKNVIGKINHDEKESSRNVSLAAITTEEYRET